MDLQRMSEAIMPGFSCEKHTTVLATEVMLVLVGEFDDVLKVIRVLRYQSTLLEDVDLVLKTSFGTEALDLSQQLVLRDARQRIDDLGVDILTEVLDVMRCLDVLLESLLLGGRDGRRHGELV
jgi:hypothetical protein